MAAIGEDGAGPPQDMGEKRPHDPFDQLSPHYQDFYPPDARANFEFRFSRKLILTARYWVHLIDNTLNAATGQNRARWQTLFAIAFAEPPVTTMKLSSDRKVRWPTLVRTLAALEKDGLVVRRENPDDGRSRLIELTDAGRAMLARIQPVIDTTRANVLADLSDADVVRMTALLDLVLERIVQRSPGVLPDDAGED